LALARHNDFREGHENKLGEDKYAVTPLLINDVALAKKLQKQMDEPTFAGESSITVPPNCQMNYYEEKDVALVSQLDKNHRATEYWYGGRGHYDYDNGKLKSGLTTAETKLGEQFTRMMWSSTMMVAFGIKKRHVAAWYCNPPQAPFNSNAYGVPTDQKAPTFKQNVMKPCVVVSTDSKGQITYMYNKCFNDRETKAHNAKRAIHVVEKLTNNAGIAREIQKILNGMPRGEPVAMPTASKRPVSPPGEDQIKLRDCGESVFTTANVLKLLTDSLATEGWYAGIAMYDFDNHRPRSPPDRKYSDQFTQMVWASTKHIGFGVRGDTVVAWYCSKGGNTPRTASQFQQNVNPICITGTGDQRWYSCYNKKATERHNRYRIVHGTESTGFTNDEGAAKAIQKMLDAGDLMNSAADRPAAYRSCGQNKFTGSSNYNVISTDAATDKWYDDGKRHYNFQGGKPKTDAGKISALRFT